MGEPSVLAEVDADGTGWLILNRPHLHNAFDDELIARLTSDLQAMAADAGVRSVVVAANGDSFSAGADLAWMRRMASASRDDNVADAMRLAEMLRTLDRLPKPTLALVQGSAFGGGVGLVAACDIAVAAGDRARFALTEVRLGLIPATIAPYVIRAIGPRQARRYMLTAETFDAEEARRLGLVHDVVPAAELRARAAAMLRDLAAGGAGALAAAKNLLADVAARPLDDAMVRHTAEVIASMRGSDEAKARITRFLDRQAAGGHP
jgi:methylglutaconyl-CoA hydratase